MNNCSDYGDTPPFFTGSERNPDNTGNAESYDNTSQEAQEKENREVLIRCVIQVESGQTIASVTWDAIRGVING